MIVFTFEKHNLHLCGEDIIQPHSHLYVLTGHVLHFDLIIISCTVC